MIFVLILLWDSMQCATRECKRVLFPQLQIRSCHYRSWERYFHISINVVIFFHTVCLFSTVLTKTFVCCKTEAGDESIVSWTKSGDPKP